MGKSDSLSDWIKQAKLVRGGTQQSGLDHYGLSTEVHKVPRLVQIAPDGVNSIARTVSKVPVWRVGLG